MRDLNPKISINKAMLGCYASTSWCGVERMLLDIVDAPVEESVLGKLEASPVNKYRSNLGALPPLLFAASGHHGGGN